MTEPVKINPRLMNYENLTNINPMLMGDAAGLSGDAKNVFGSCTKITGDVTGLKGNVTYIAGDVTNIFGVASNISGRIKDLHGDVTNIIGYVGSLSGTVTNIRGKVFGITGFVSKDLRGDVTKILGNVTDLYGDCSNIYGTVTHLSGDVTELEGDVSNYFGPAEKYIGKEDLKEAQSMETGMNKIKVSITCLGEKSELKVPGLLPIDLPTLRFRVLHSEAMKEDEVVEIEATPAELYKFIHVARLNVNKYIDDVRNLTTIASIEEFKKFVEDHIAETDPYEGQDAFYGDEDFKYDQDQVSELKKTYSKTEFIIPLPDILTLLSISDKGIIEDELGDILKYIVYDLEGITEPEKMYLEALGEEKYNSFIAWLEENVDMVNTFVQGLGTYFTKLKDIVTDDSAVQLYEHALESVVEDALNGDVDQQKFIETIWSESWLDIKQKLAARDADIYRVWWRDGVLAYIDKKR